MRHHTFFVGTSKSKPDHEEDWERWESYGLLEEWDYYGADYYLLPTMAYDMHYDKEVYMNFWEQCREDVRQF
jgi:hypothetical protein